MPVTRGARVILLGLLAVLTVSHHAVAQTRATTADLFDVIRDESNAIVPGAAVTATNTATGLDRTSWSGPDGRYSLPALPPGVYTVKCSLAGFGTQVAANVVLVLGQAAELSFTLRVAARSEDVTVLAESEAVEMQRTAVSTVVPQRLIDALPTNGRNFLAFSVLTPAVNADRTPQQGASATSGLTFAGQRGRSNNITVDGVDNNDIITGGVRATFSQEAVQEFQVLANSYSAEFGKASGGLVNIVTRSGGNRVSGNAFAFFRDEALNASEHFELFDPAGNALDQGKAPYSRRQFGGTLGGPIRRDRSFYFLSFEQLRSRPNNFVNIDDTTPVVVFGQDYGTAVEILDRAGFPVETGHVPYRVDSDQVLAKVDVRAGQRHQLALRFNWADLLDENAEPWGGQIARSRGASLDSSDYMGAALLTSIFSARTVNELRFQLAYRDQKVYALDPACDGACDQITEGGPTIEVGGIGAGRQRLTPNPRTNTRVQILDTLTRDAGRHLLKAGFDFSRVDYGRMMIPVHFGGRYVFSALPAIPALGLPAPVDALQALALGVPAAYIQSYGDPSGKGGERDISLFFQDDWRVRNDLTLKLGVRYQNQFESDVTFETPDLPPYGWPSDNNNFAPRVGFSWNPGDSRRTSVRAFYGVFYDLHISTIWGTAKVLNGRADGLRTRAVMLPTPYPVMAWRTPGHKVPEPETPYPSFTTIVSPGLRTPLTHQASAGIERTLGSSLTVTADLVYARGSGLVSNLDYNPVINPATGARPLDGAAGPGSSTTVWQYTSWGETWYRGLVLSARRRFDGRSEFQASYTLSDAEDTAVDYAFQQPQDLGRGRNPADPAGLPLGFNPDLERGPSLQDQRHRFLFTGVYAMPWDITLSGIAVLGSGRPFNILAGVDLNGNKDGGGSPADRPRRVLTDPSTSVGRNTGRLPAQYTVDLRIAKRVGLGNRAKLDLMIDLFNVFNRTNYTEIDGIFGPGPYPDNPRPTYGQHTAAAPPFQAQLGAKVSF
jgi:hypothetical protein